MPKIKKSPIFQYGIEITKPHSKQMYDHNDHVANVMKINISNVATDIWNDLFYCKWESADWASHKDDKFKTFTVEQFQKAICYSGFGSGFDVLEVFSEIRKELELAENWRMHELYQEMHEAGMVPAIEHEMVGFTNNYNKDYPTYATTSKVA